MAREGDPQAAALAVLLGRFIGDDKALIRSTIHAAIAIGLEIGSGFGLFALFGHHGRRREDDAAQDSSTPPASSDLPALEARPNGAVTIETPSDVVARFFAECVVPAAGQRVSATQMYAAYERWCGAQNHTAVSYDRFRKLATWRTARIGGRSWYLDAALSAPGGIRLASRQRPSPARAWQHGEQRSIALVSAPSWSPASSASGGSPRRRPIRRKGFVGAREAPLYVRR